MRSFRSKLVAILTRSSFLPVPQHCPRIVMQPIQMLSAGLTGAVLFVSGAIAQEKNQEKKKQVVPAKAIRAMRLAGGGNAKPPSQEELKSRYAAKLEGAWIKKARWITDFDQARSAARESGNQILAYFTRSYAP